MKSLKHNAFPFLVGTGGDRFNSGQLFRFMINNLKMFSILIINLLEVKIGVAGNRS